MNRYEPIVQQMKLRHNIRVKRWRKSMSGCAWRVWFDDGSVINWIESPYPKSPLSLAIFLHEVGHHVIGFDTFKHRCEEEYHAWQWSLDQLRMLGIEPTDKVWQRYERSMAYAVGKAMRRGIRSMPGELERFVPLAA